MVAHFQYPLNFVRVSLKGSAYVLASAAFHVHTSPIKAVILIHGLHILSEQLRGLGKVDREVHCYKDGYQLDIHEMFVSR